jgi:hypothetical protein
MERLSFCVLTQKLGSWVSGGTTLESAAMTEFASGQRPSGSPSAFRGRVSSGFPSRLHRSRLLSERFGALAALVDDVGAPCHVAGPTAAALHSFDGFELAAPFHLVVPRGRFVSRVGHVIHTSTRVEPIDLERVAGLGVTSPTRTLIDIAACTGVAPLTAALDSALRDGLTSEDFLHRRIVALRGKGRHGLPRLLDVLTGVDPSRGGHSWLEREFLARLSAAGMPMPDTQQVLARRGERVVRVDCRFPGTDVVVELLGYRFHRSAHQMQIDAQRSNALLLEGFRPFQFTYVDVVEHMPTVLSTVAGALSARQVPERRASTGSMRAARMLG